MDQQVVRNLSSGGVAVIPTDTIYGLVGNALNLQTVERIYKIKGRSPEKPFIILISDMAQLNLFGITPTDELNTYWPGPVSIILPCDNEKFRYLHRGTGSLAFRLPAKDDLRQLLSKTGPLVAPSANPEGEQPAATVAEAKAYFGRLVDGYQGASKLIGAPSRLIKITNGEVEVLR